MPFVQVGKMNTLSIVRNSDFGLYLDGGPEFGEILLPRGLVPPNSRVGQSSTVFIYFDSEDRIVATPQKPYAMADDFALLKVVSKNVYGAFLDWGLAKDLLLPITEQRNRQEIEIGEYVLVKIYVDQVTGRIAASTRIEQFLDQSPAHYEPNQEVSLRIVRETDLGFLAIINDTHSGLLYREEVFDHLRPGDLKNGYIKRIREDGKIDLSLYPLGYAKVKDLSQTILKHLQFNHGFLPLTDQSPPYEIYERFGVSKKSFKKAIGSLYKQRLIQIEEKGIRLIAD